MKIRLLILVLILSLALISETDLAKEDLEGKVKAITSSTFKADTDSEELVWELKSTISAKTIKIFDVKGNLIEEKNFMEDGTIFSSSVYEYDESGNNSKIIDSDGAGIKYCYKYDYDEDGNMLEEKQFGANDDLLGKYIFEYDEKGYKIKSQEIDTDGNVTTTYKYVNNNDGKPVEQKIFDGDEQRNHTKIEYDENGNLTKSWLYDEDDNLKETNILTYNENDKPVTMISENKIDEVIKKYDYVYNDIDKVSQVELYENAVLVRSEDYEYNEHGDDKWMKFDLEGTITTYRYEYKYDDQGNWAEKIEYKNDEPDIKYIREITYYE
ncbi:MAG: hypothetical protein K9N09_01165 [Candidatus Cloacimonetes bacterium]|nr:hypothetical protein [Candidatus Cloacimonadota bacterium]MCF7812984.1 hypothetical protein [Candidatus Cloacimonadota bacterium]MCF7867284.1 hypothetical protein [Candidatus Cloacimonadota bacterium]MCF7882728.1 hypothetical protein [Candidatus Cloacimonadota bacterium]